MGNKGTRHGLRVTEYHFGGDLLGQESSYKTCDLKLTKETCDIDMARLIMMNLTFVSMTLIDAYI